MLETILPFVLEIVATFFITLIGVFGAWLMAKINQNKKLTNIGIATKQVIEAAQQTVLELKQTVVDDLKKDGKFTDERIEEVRELLLDMTFEKLSVPVLKLLGAATVDINAIIIGAGEAFIGDLKLNPLP